MIRLTIPEEEIEQIDQERFRCADPHVCRRLHAMYLKAKGKSHQEIAEFTGLSLNGLTHIFKLYAQEGLSAVRILNYSLPKSALDPYRELLKKHFEQHPPASVNQACDDIERLTGITRSPSRIHTFLHQLGMQPRKVGGIPSKADPERQEEFKKKVWSQC